MSIFHFKEFSICQSENAQKIGTDSMLLGAWTSPGHQRILDIGTGTGILALMMAQKNPSSVITAIEPVATNFNEAVNNFNASKYSHQILAIQTELQQFGAVEKFDLIICNPPYFNSTYLSDSDIRNQARHQTNLTTHELYECAADLLSEDGLFNLIIPANDLESHLHSAVHEDLHLQKVLFTISPDGLRKRALISVGFNEVDPQEVQMLIKDKNNQYSKEYIQLTADFYLKDLSKKH